MEHCITCYFHNIQPAVTFCFQSVKELEADLAHQVYRCVEQTDIINNLTGWPPSELSENPVKTQIYWSA